MFCYTVQFLLHFSYFNRFDLWIDNPAHKLIYILPKNFASKNNFMILLHTHLYIFRQMFYKLNLCSLKLEIYRSSCCMALKRQIFRNWIIDIKFKNKLWNYLLILTETVVLIYYKSKFNFSVDLHFVYI